MSGFIALHREAFDHPLLKDGERFRAWFWLVANAAYMPTRHDARGKIIEVQRGQICAGREYLAKVWGWSASAVERFLARLETEQMIERQTGQLKTVITISNYDKYQDLAAYAEHMSGQSSGQKSDRNRTAKEQRNQDNQYPSDTPYPQDEVPAPAIDQNPIKKSAKPKRKVRSADEPMPEVPDWMPVEAWNAYLAMRDRKRASPTPHAVSLIIAQLDEFRRFGHDPTAVLNYSTMNNYTGIFEPKAAKNDRSHSTFPVRDTRDGVAKALDRRLGIDRPAGEAGRRDFGEGSGFGLLPAA